jgi:hypothetical protein
MRWPWQRREPDPTEAAITEQQTKSEKVLRRAFDALRARTTKGIDSAEQKIVDDYARAEEERRK